MNNVFKLNIIVFLLSIPAMLKASCGKEPILLYRDDKIKIEIFHCNYEGREYVELRNLNLKYQIVCELNKTKQICLLSDYRNDLYRYQGYGISDTSNGVWVCPNGETLKVSLADSSIRRADSFELQLLQHAILNLDTRNSNDYNIDLSKILLFVAIKE